MEIFNHITKLSDRFPGIAVALGTFDGVHIGHQKIIRRAVELARASGGTSAVFTFSNHPLSIVAPNRCPLQIITPQHKAKIIEALGVDLLLSIPFTAEFLKIAPSEFLGMLNEKLNPAFIVVGPNYSFGYRSAGNPKLLKSAEQHYGFKAEVHPAVHIENQLVSSTTIRELIAEGNVAKAALLLGRFLRIEGTVVDGEKRGRELGFPTANLAIADGVAMPDDGVYAVTVGFEGENYQGVANVGTNPTFSGIKRHIEVYIFDFSRDIYGKTLEVDFIKHIRKEMVFNSVADLKVQIKADVENARQIHKR